VVDHDIKEAGEVSHHSLYLYFLAAAFLLISMFVGQTCKQIYTCLDKQHALCCSPSSIPCVHVT